MIFVGGGTSAVANVTTMLPSAAAAASKTRAIKTFAPHKHDGGTRTNEEEQDERTKLAALVKPKTMNSVISILIYIEMMLMMMIVSNCQANDYNDNAMSGFSNSNNNHHHYSDDSVMMAEPLALAYGGGEEKPRLIPLVVAESGYSENSSVNILCTVSQGHHETLTFDWFRDGQLLPIGSTNQQQRQHHGGDKIINNNNNNDQVNEATNEFNQQVLGSTQATTVTHPQIEKHSDHSLLRIARVQWQHSGRYTCSVKNQFGQDSSSVNLIVNVKLQWIKEPPKEVVVSVNQELKVDCLAQGEPKPTMRWEKLDSTMTMVSRFRGSTNLQAGTGAAAAGSQFQSYTTSISAGGGNADGIMMMMPIHSMAKNQLATKESNGNYKLAQQQHSAFAGQPPAGSGANHQNSVLVSSNRHLNIQRAKESDAGIYECIATNSHDTDLRKLVHVQVRGPPKILPIATADSYPEGSSINLICTVSGGQRRGLVLSWTMNGEPLDDQRLKYSGLFDNLSIGTDDADISILKIKNATNSNSGQYTCTAKNPLGQDSTSVKIVINVELKWNKIPKDVEVGLNHELSIECDAVGEPKPTIEWFKHSTQMDRNSNGTMLVSKSNLLKLNKAQHKDSGLYECVARNGVDEDLRKVIQVKVRGPPKILPIATADSYPEGSTINLICTVSGGQRKGLTLAWSKDGEEFNEQLLRYSNSMENVSIEKTGVDISILRLTNATHANSGRFSCNAKNPLGEDSTSVNIVINVELKWNKLPSDTEIGLHQDVAIECDAIGQPQPQITWTRHPSSNGARPNNETNKSVIVSQGKLLKIQKAQHKDSGLYECSARNGVDQDLRRIIQLRVRGKFLNLL